MKNILVILVIIFTIRLNIEAKITDSKVLTQHTIDTWSIDAIVKAIVKPGMTNEEKALAVWYFLRPVYFHYLYPEPIEGYGDMFEYSLYAPSEFNDVEDPIKNLNVYGRSICGMSAFVQMEIWQTMGFKTRRVSLPYHVSAEVFYDNKWHYIDSDMIGYIYTRDGSRIASLEDIHNDPEILSNPSIRKASDPLYPNKVFIAKFKNNYKYESEIYPQFFAEELSKSNWKIQDMGERNSFSLHTGTFTLPIDSQYILTWDNKEKKYYYPKDWKKNPANIPQELETRAEHKLPDWVYVYGIRSYAEGYYEYEPNLTNEDFLDAVEAKNEISWFAQDKITPYLHPKEVNKTGSITFKVTTPYIIADAILTATFVKKTENDVNKVYISVWSGEKYLPEYCILPNSQTGENEETINLGEIPYLAQGTQAYYRSVTGRYTFKVRFEFKAVDDIKNAGLNKLKIRTVVNLNKYVLPRLSFGKNEISFSSTKIDTKNTLCLEYFWEERGDGARQGMQTHKEVIENATYQYFIEVKGSSDPKMLQLVYSVNGEGIGINEGKKQFEHFLGQNYPNPFNPECYIPYEVQCSMLNVKILKVKIKIYNILGQIVRELNLGEKEAGNYITKDRAAYWNGRDAQGKEVVSGMYYYELMVDGKVIGLKKSLVIK